MNEKIKDDEAQDSCPVALKNIEIIEREHLVERAAYLGRELRNKLQTLLDHPQVGDIRNFGFIAGIEMVEHLVDAFSTLNGY
jgi:taurine-pyruvate aminotransferase